MNGGRTTDPTSSTTKQQDAGKPISSTNINSKHNNSTAGPASSTSGQLVQQVSSNDDGILTAINDMCGTVDINKKLTSATVATTANITAAWLPTQEILMNIIDEQIQDCRDNCSSISSK